ncbi:hypothetical protein K435DRAFT_848006 [Dendrothele bispora CBS 962.96]|uniref:Uncharacterized protein n=1 Tax=Dendrothele bispora (strain CBS 962.96) TaxID=1314807 RepID=A0A4S8MY09_DENBC|nr:hypothetical protein K435DRAFT_848006 [Dendrothele bispora CBS 962.96]
MAMASMRVSMRLVEGRKEEWPEESEYYHITQADLPIVLDDPPAPATPSPASSLTLRPSIRSRSRMPRFPKLAFLTKKRSILDEFPPPPSHVPTPSSATQSTASTWPVEWPSLDSESKGSLQNRFKTLTNKIFTRTKKESTFSISKDTFEYRKRRSSSLRALHTQSKALPDAPGDVQDVVSYPVVDPSELTASPLSLLIPPSTKSSFLPPSPSWLSRNVAHLEPENTTPVTPQSPLPLPIPPRILVTNTESPPLSPLEATEGFLSTPGRSQRPQHSRSSSWADLKESETALLLQPQPQSPHKSTSSLVVAKPLPATPSFSNRDIFIPTTLPAESEVPPQLRTLFSALCSEAGLFISNLSNITDISSVSNLNPIHNSRSRTNMDTTYGKRSDVVDAGGEYDYSGMQWFKDPPLRPQPVPQPTGTPYVPPPEVIEQNEAFRFALSAAPNVLYGRYKHYGQLGVLAWCSEFSELIDNLKELGFAGNMFVSTRSQALKTCEEILQLHLDVKMQIIVLYLSSQVQRLRRFLDGERIWEDYPEPQFPLDYTQYSRQ